ncbi:hypothetical protein [Burkholderia pyrrocinia]|uniref:hypothetical protein n=1 Tax=Burkholderia pyrrocinia TaxID=60550 RepID=UPI002AAFECF1|nr:hypothetical protein [Burkholderia pyrrocinia]
MLKWSSDNPSDEWCGGSLRQYRIAPGNLRHRVASVHESGAEPNPGRLDTAGTATCSRYLQAIVDRLSNLFDFP